MADQEVTGRGGGAEVADPRGGGAAPEPSRRKRVLAFALVAGLTAVLTFGVTMLLVTIFQRKQEAKNPYLKLVEVGEDTTDPAVWGTNWARQYDSYQRTVDATRTRYGGSDGMPEQKLDREPWLRRMYAGYAFSLDYRDRRGHAYMLFDQEHTERVLQRPQPGACLHCHASVIPTYRRIGLPLVDASGGSAHGGTDAFNWPAVMAGFEKVSAMKYADAHAELTETPSDDGQTGPHPVSCVDCHDPGNMQLRVTRPGFVNGIQALAESDSPVPHLPSIERWRQGSRKQPYDPNVDATRQEMRSFACGQCHVEYYFRGEGKLVTYPWHNGLRVEEIESYYDDGANFKDGQPYSDWKHAETSAGVIKAQHPEFEMWSQGVHARSGVSCADCHMPYVREGALKVSDHWVRSPLLNVNNACQTCHKRPEEDLLARAQTMQDRTHKLIGQASDALTDMYDAILQARGAGVADEQLADAFDLQRRAQWRLDFISSENSMGFHADQETARVLAEAIDFARQGQVAALSLRAPEAEAAQPPEGQVEGVTPAEEAPEGVYNLTGRKKAAAREE